MSSIILPRLDHGSTTDGCYKITFPDERIVDILSTDFFNRLLRTCPSFRYVLRVDPTLSDRLIAQLLIELSDDDKIKLIQDEYFKSIPKKELKRFLKSIDESKIYTNVISSYAYDRLTRWYMNAEEEIKKVDFQKILKGGDHNEKNNTVNELNLYTF